MSLLKKGSLIRFGGVNQAPPQPVNLWSVGDAVTDGSLSSQFSSIVSDDASKLEDGSTYRVEFDYDITFGSLQLIVGNAGPIATVGSGNTIIEVTASPASFFRVRQTTSNTIGSMTNISVTKV